MRSGRRETERGKERDRTRDIANQDESVWQDNVYVKQAPMRLFLFSIILYIPFQIDKTKKKNRQ